MREHIQISSLSPIHFDSPQFKMNANANSLTSAELDILRKFAGQLLNDPKPEVTADNNNDKNVGAVNSSSVLEPNATVGTVPPGTETVKEKSTDPENNTATVGTPSAALVSDRAARLACLRELILHVTTDITVWFKDKQG